MSQISDYKQELSKAIEVRRDWIARDIIPDLKENLRAFQSSYTSLYSTFLKKGLVNEDPYKQEAKLNELQTPETGNFAENEKDENMSVRLSNFDNQLDFLVNFYHFDTDFLTIDRIRKIFDLIRYIDWVHLSQDSASINTRYVARFVAQMKTGFDAMSISLMNESMTNLMNSTRAAVGYLKILTEFNKEAYKLEVRDAITSVMPETETPSLAKVKKQFASALPKKPFYPELVEELIREDYGKTGAELQEAVLHSLEVVKKKQAPEKKEVPLKTFLIDSLHSLGAISDILVETASKLDENKALLENKKLSLFKKFIRYMKYVFNSKQEDIIYEIEYTDTTQGRPNKKKLNFTKFRADVDKRIKNLGQLAVSKGVAAAKLEALPEQQLLSFLEQNFRDLKKLTRDLNALDTYFKANVGESDHDHVKGIKPELSTIKNALVKANQKCSDYTALKEEADQLKRLDITKNKDEHE
ncbi:MAG: hypothetical protein LBK25_00510 [Treponema sp.]|jgi:hypothetical protein|nr:hypothetical protein [Treponema sp.]